MLIKNGHSPQLATDALLHKEAAFKNELLFKAGINFNQVPAWQRRGVGLYWENYDKEGINPQTGAVVVSQRRRIVIDEELPIKDEYSLFLQRFL